MTKSDVADDFTESLETFGDGHVNDRMSVECDRSLQSIQARKRSLTSDDKTFRTRKSARLALAGKNV